MSNNRPSFVSLNLGTGLKTSVLDLISTFEIVNKVKIPYKICKERIGDTAFLLASNAKAMDILNWEFKNSLEDMCRDGWKWQTLNPNGYLD